MTDTSSDSLPNERLLDIENLSAGYAGVAVIRGINLNVQKGEVVALLGPNGAGKTTTLLTTSGLLKALEGSVTVLGEVSNFGAPHKTARLGLAHVPEDRSLFFGLTVQENLRLGLRGKRSDQAAGYDAAMTIGMQTWSMVEGGWASEHDRLIGNKVAHILCGGAVSAGAGRRSGT